MKWIVIYYLILNFNFQDYKYLSNKQLLFQFYLIKTVKERQKVNHSLVLAEFDGV
jgi:hypothetical protein